MDRAGSYYFLEVNTRLQVEHTVTEMISGLDLVREQLLIAGGEQPERRQEDILLSGHALECRINVEDAEHGFAPSAGQVTVYLPPGGPQVRVDSHLYTGYHVPPHYDSLVAKVVTWGHDRAEAVAVMRRALDELTIEGVATTVAFQRRIIGDPLFERGEISTTSVDEYFLAQPAGGVLMAAGSGSPGSVPGHGPAEGEGSVAVRAPAQVTTVERLRRRQRRWTGRRQARMLAFQALFGLDLNSHPPDVVIRRRLAEAGEVNEQVADYVTALVEGTWARLPEIDTRLAKAAPAWPLSQMARVDKSVLRLAIYELLYRADVPRPSRHQRGHRASQGLRPRHVRTVCQRCFGHDPGRERNCRYRGE